MRYVLVLILPFVASCNGRTQSPADKRDAAPVVAVVGADAGVDAKGPDPVPDASPPALRPPATPGSAIKPPTRCASPALEINLNRMSGRFEVEKATVAEGKVPHLYFDIHLRVEGDQKVVLRMILARPVERPWSADRWLGEFAIGHRVIKIEEPTGGRGAEIRLGPDDGSSVAYAKPDFINWLTEATGTVRVTYNGAFPSWACGEIDLTSPEGTIKGTWAAQQVGF